jgi:hypothetical protein
MAQQADKPSAKARIQTLLRNPTRLRVAITVVLAGIWFFAIYQPTVAQIGDKQQRLETERKRLALAETIGDLRAETQRFKLRLPKHADQNAAIQYLLDGVRSFPLSNTTLDPKSPKEIGPFKTLVADLGVDGQYADLEKLLRWLETNSRLYRIDQIRIDPAKVGKGERPAYRMQLIVIGVLG